MPEAAVDLALEVAQEALRAKEMPIGAVVISGDDILVRAYTKKRDAGLGTSSRRRSSADRLITDRQLPLITAQCVLRRKLRELPARVRPEIDPLVGERPTARVELLQDELRLGLDRSPDAGIQDVVCQGVIEVVAVLPTPAAPGR